VGCCGFVLRFSVFEMVLLSSFVFSPALLLNVMLASFVLFFVPDEQRTWYHFTSLLQAGTRGWLYV